MSEFAPVIVAAALKGADGYRLDGNLANYGTGSTVAGGGDVNGDGLADLLIGAPIASVGGIRRGLAYVVFGATAPPAAQFLNSRVAAGTAYVFIAELVDDRFGYSIANAGDVNGDGFDDLIIGAPSADPDAAASERGASYLVFGGTAKLEALDAADGVNDNIVSIFNLAPGTGYRFDGGANSDNSGHSVSGAGDMDNDGFADLIIGAPRADLNGGSDNGASYIVFGGSGSLASLDDDDTVVDGRIDLVQISASQGLRLDGETAFPRDLSGDSVALVGDVNGDGFGDALVGASYADDSTFNNTNDGAAYLVFGRPQSQFTAATLLLGNFDGLQVTRFLGVTGGDNAGDAVNGLGDVNGDGFADFAIGASGADPSGNSSGRAHVVFGKSAFGHAFNLAALTGANGFSLDGVRPGDLTGSSVSAAGDVNGDGFADILVGAWNFDRIGVDRPGAAYVVFGKASGFQAAIDLGSLDGDSGFRIEGTAEFETLGFRNFGAAGDVNGDGFDDVAVGAQGADSNALNDSGSTYVIYGHRADTAVTRVGTALANKMNGGRDDDTISGLSGNDTLTGWEGDDLLKGDAGVDTLNGGTDDDTLDAGSGNDVLIGGAGEDSFSGGSGTDTATYVATLGVTVALDGSVAGTGDALGDTFASVESVNGSNNGNDSLTGNAAANTLRSYAGTDTLRGQAGNDNLLGGAGVDTLTGGLGQDRFQYSALTELGDSILDFTAVDDTVALLKTAFGNISQAGVAAAFFSSPTTNTSSSAATRFIYEVDDTRLWYDADGTGATAAVMIANLQAGAAFTAADIIII